MIIDVHCHLGTSPGFHFPDPSTATILRTMDRLGIERAIFCHLAMLHGELALGLRESIAACRMAPGRFAFYTVFEPGRDGAIEFVKESLEQPGCVGIKLHPSFHRCAADDDAYEPIWRLAAERNLPMLTHSWDISDDNPSQKFSFPTRFERYISVYPEVKLILGHAGGRYGGHVAAADLARRYPNVFLDIAGDCYVRGLLEYLAENAGEDKVLFGSDLTWIDPRTQLGMVLDAEIPVGVKEKILRLNALRIFP
ncbi:MAG: amidohydrolase [Pirellulales bacterium]|nr:amidohydrolase [Pirellulales bacterium]